MAQEIQIGIDLGGTKIEIIALDTSGKELYRQRTATPRNGYKPIIRTIGKILKECEAAVGPVENIGIGTPGAISPASNLMKNSNTTCLNGMRLDKDLEKELGKRVFMANDANCFALSEAIDGAAAGAKVVFGVILGTGVGGGIVVQGQVLTGPNAIAGEWGHCPLPWPADDERPGPKCYCGNLGCIETFLSGPGISSDYERAYGSKLSASEISSLNGKGDKKTGLIMSRYEGRLARALSVVINILDPNVIVLGGGLSNIMSLYENVPKIWNKYVFSDHVSTRLVSAKYGDSSGVRGAAWLSSQINRLSSVRP